MPTRPHIVVLQYLQGVLRPPQALRWQRRLPSVVAAAAALLGALLQPAVAFDAADTAAAPLPAALEMGSALPARVIDAAWVLPVRAQTSTLAVAQRSQEIAECRPSEMTNWADGHDRQAVALPLRMVYDPAGAPSWFNVNLVLQSLLRAAEAWSSGCGVPATVLPLAPGQSAGDLPAGSVLVQWNEERAQGNFGLTHLGQRRLWLGSQAFRTLHARNPRHPAEATLQMVISHEMGHLFGLMAHSSRCVDVMSYYSNAQGERCHSREDSAANWRGDYRALLPTACDLARCRAANSVGQTASAQ